MVSHGCEVEPFRKYDPSAGRWLSPDPSGWNAASATNPQSLNRYAYVLNNPMSLTDPTGLDCTWTNDDGSVSVSEGDCPTTGPGANGTYINCDGCGGWPRSRRVFLTRCGCHRSLAFGNLGTDGMFAAAPVERRSPFVPACRRVGSPILTVGSDRQGTSE